MKSQRRTPLSTNTHGSDTIMHIHLRILVDYSAPLVPDDHFAGLMVSFSVMLNWKAASLSTCGIL